MVIAVENLDRRARKYIGAYGVNSDHIIPVTDWVNLSEEPDRLATLRFFLNTQRDILSDPNRIAFFIDFDGLICVFPSPPNGYVDVDNNRVFRDGNWV